MKTLSEWLERKPSGPRPKKPLKRTGRIRQVSKKRAKEDRTYSEKRKAFLAAHPICQSFATIRGHYSLKKLELPTDTPTGVQRSTEIHHTRKPRCKYLNDESTWLAVSRWSHDWIESNKATARQIGLLK